MSEQWYYARGSATYGPVSWDLLQQLAAEGEVRSECLIWREGMPQWLPAAALGLGVAPASSSAPALAAPSFSEPPALPAVSRSEQSAALPAPPPIATSRFVPAAPRGEPRAAPETKPRATRPARRVSPTLAAVGVVAVVLAMALGWLVSEASRSNRTAADSTTRASKHERRPHAEASRQPMAPPAANRTPSSRESVAPRAEALTPRAATTGAGTPGETGTSGVASRKSTQRADNLPEFSPDAPAVIPAEPAGPSAIPPAPPAAKTPVDPATVPSTPSSPPASATPTTEPESSNSTTAPPSAPSSSSVPSTKPNQPRSAPNSLFQLIDVARAPKFEVLGTVMAQDLRYQILSQLYVDDSDLEGGRVVEQVVLDTRLLKADDLSRDQFVNSLRELIGWRCKYKVRPTGDVVDFQAVNKGRGEVLKVGAPGAEGFMITSVLDADGWREIAELTFFRPRPTQSNRDSWSRQTMHDFGPLGSWYGTTTFKPGVERRGAREFTYSHTLDHERPAKPAPAAPFRVTGAKLVPEKAAGVIRYNDKLEQVESVREEFKVRGRVDVELAGQAIPVGLEEWQIIELGLHARNPWKK